MLDGRKADGGWQIIDGGTRDWRWHIAHPKWRMADGAVDVGEKRPGVGTGRFRAGFAQTAMIRRQGGPAFSAESPIFRRDPSRPPAAIRHSASSI